MTPKTETCEYCGYSFWQTHPQTGQELFRDYNGHTLCASHYSEAKYPETYTRTPPIQEWLQ